MQMTDDQADALQKENAVELGNMAKLNPNAAGMVQSLLLDLRSNGSFIKLQAAQAHTVRYVFVEGTPKHVALIGKRLGLTVDATTIEVPHA
jgi:hypothetical protein